ncbi:glycosyltransferase, group 2 family protein (glycan biosynthesis) [Legionella sainthelensi]|uniref:Glycosyltransferase, group 2 family protein (Glycan biosynthesis) n=1 Tax=Legionella sainthelensi TaxID=28087 RepID=A0A0W0YN28_9GAMM|nr:glycosyltransferase family 2 protein [Legionella sainthelensi]KTD58298.1 glycosyltransferase, group 2 family protein (glycan biosynthesis) [Legionella sainthelensi]VEH27106.1 glycosyltransferase, group 2 family protein (glycan biosynthesis) [Legionella sainthelensi]
MKLSIVATLYKSEKYIIEFCQRLSLVAEQLVGNSYEIVLVNDGSPDDSLETAIKQMDQNPQIIVVDLSRNFGHHKAMMTGLAHARGEHIFLIDSDLEEKPEWLLSFAKQMKEECCDVVYGVQEVRKGGVFERWSGALFYRFLRFLSSEPLPTNITVARLMTRRYVNALLLHKEREIYIAGLWYLTGFEQHPQTVKKESSSETTYTLRRKVSLFVNSVTSFSNLPLVSIFYFGLLIMFFACSYIGWLIINKFLFHNILEGWTSVMASIWLLGGLIISFIGIVGIYLSKIFLEIKRRPYTIIRHIYQKIDHTTDGHLKKTNPRIMEPLNNEMD